MMPILVWVCSLKLLDKILFMDKECCYISPCSLGFARIYEQYRNGKKSIYNLHFLKGIFEVTDICILISQNLLT